MEIFSYIVNGWSPIISLVSDGARIVMKVVGWTGGTGGSVPASDVYIGATGYVPLIADAVDVRGSTGATGATGATGNTGATGAGVAAGGTANQALTKINSTDYNTQWATIDKTFVGLGSADDTSDANKPVSTAQQTALDLKANLASPTFTGTVVLPNSTVTNAMLAGSIAYSKLVLTGAILNADLVGSIANAKLANSAITINGTLVALGASIDSRPLSASVSGSDVTTTSASATDVTGLSIAVVANKKYRVTASLWIGCNNTGGVQFAINGPAGSAVLSGAWQGSAGAASTNQTVKLGTIGTLSAAGATFIRVNSAGGMVNLIGYITTSATSGSITIQFASNVGGQTSTVFIGSTMDIIEVV